MIGWLVAAWLDTRSRPIRTMAAIAGLVAAVCAVITINAASVLSREANNQFIQETYGRRATISVSSPDDAVIARDDPASPTSLITYLTENGVTRVSVNERVGGVLINGDQFSYVDAQWVSSVYPWISLVDIDRSQFPIVTAHSPLLHLVINRATALDLGLDADTAIGHVVSYAPESRMTADLRTTVTQPVVIDGVSDSLGIGDPSRSALIVSDDYRPDLAGGHGLTWLVHVASPDVPMAMELIRKYRWESTDPTAVLAVSRVDLGEDLQPLLDQQHKTADVITIIALIVGGLGVLAVGLANVNERSQEYGLRRAIGGNRVAIFLTVIAQTLIQGLLAAIAAVALSELLIRAFARNLVLKQLPLPHSTSIPLSSALLGIAGALLVGFVAGLIPAVRAARVSVVKALQG